MKTVTIFGSSRPKEGEPEFSFAYELGKQLAQNGFRVCNGGYAGVMRASAMGAKAAGGKTIGVTLGLNTYAHNEFLDETIHCESLFPRVEELMRRGDAYIVLQGGTGTLLELAAVWEFINKRFMPVRPIFVHRPFWDSVVSLMANQLRLEQRLPSEHYLRQFTTVEEVVVGIKSSDW